MSDTPGLPFLDLAAVRAALDARCGQPARIRTHWADCHLFAGHELCLAFRLLHECERAQTAAAVALLNLRTIIAPEALPLGTEIRVQEAVKYLRAIMRIEP